MPLTLGAIPSTFAQATMRLGTRDCRKLGYQTWLVRQGPDVVVLRHWATDIAEYRHDGTLALTMGRWTSSPTTRARLNRALPAGWQLWSERGTVWVAWARGPRYAVEDGMTLDATGATSATPAPFVRVRGCRYSGDQIGLVFRACGHACAWLGFAPNRCCRCEDRWWRCRICRRGAAPVGRPA